MASDPGSTAGTTTTESVAAQAQSRGEAAHAAARRATGRCAGEGLRFLIGEAVRRAQVVPYKRGPDDPLYRPLRIYTMDPAVPRRDGAVATLNVPFEPLGLGPSGALFTVDSHDPGTGALYRSADLDARNVLIADGYDPSPSDPRFHQQMAYAVCSSVYAAFRTALGRNLSWGFGNQAQPTPLVLRVHHGRMRNAYYAKTPAQGEICFGYFPADPDSTDLRSLPGGYIFTCLSHDIVAHEVTHALLDGLRMHFGTPTSADVVAFHEAFADLVAIFQHFSYREVVLSGIRKARGDLAHDTLLNQLARQFGHTTGQNGPLRSAIEPEAQPARYDAEAEPHALGNVLVNAVFEAFTQVFRRKTAVYLRLATGGSGELPPGELPHDLQTLLAEEASKLASQFLNICIRAIDYCPPVGLSFGDYLRALITADVDVVPDDRWDYRGALIEAFRRRNIYPRSVTSLAVDALMWHPPRIALPPEPLLHFGELRFAGDPAEAAGTDELLRQACALGEYVSRPAHRHEFGLVAPDDPALDGDTVELPCIESIRSARRSGPNGQIVFDLVAEITQRRHVRAQGDQPAFSYHGGATVIMGPGGEFRYVVLKSVTGRGRVERRRSFLASRQGARYWLRTASGAVPRPDLFQRVHADGGH